MKWNLCDSELKLHFGHYLCTKHLAMRKNIASKNKNIPPTAQQNQPNYSEFLWYKKHEKALLSEYMGRFIVIKNEEVIGNYDTKTEAWQATIPYHAPGNFIIHHCVPVDVKRLPRLASRQFVTIHE